MWPSPPANGASKRDFEFKDEFGRPERLAGRLAAGYQQIDAHPELLSRFSSTSCMPWALLSIRTNSIRR